ncbi:MAG: heavy-metal-associated domain-containing protein [Gammaproteobacteria bacterium]|jgi:copper chaperone CopZ
MKFIKIFLLLILLNTNSVYSGTKGHTDHPHDHGITISKLSAGDIDTDGEQINVNVFGLVCDFCAQAIEKVFMKREEVAGIKVDLSAGLIAIFTKKDLILDDETLTKLILDSGYNVDSISRTKL